MPVKIRLQPKGKRNQKQYSIVIADARFPVKGKYIEKIGHYRTFTTPNSFEIDFDKALDWLEKGAQPTPTVKTILSRAGVLYKKHLLGGVKKYALTEEEAEKKFNDWIEKKKKKIQSNALNLKKREELDKMIRRGDLPHDKQKKKTFYEKNKVDKSLSITNSLPSEYKTPSNFRSLIKQEYLVESIHDNYTIDKKKENNMEIAYEEVNTYTLGVEVFLNNEESNILYKEKEYLLKVALKLDDINDQNYILNEFSVLITPETSEIKGVPVRKVEFDENRNGISDFGIIPKYAGEENIEIEFMQNIKTVKKVPLKFEIR